MISIDVASLDEAEKEELLEFLDSKGIAYTNDQPQVKVSPELDNEIKQFFETLPKLKGKDAVNLVAIRRCLLEAKIKYVGGYLALDGDFVFGNKVNSVVKGLLPEYKSLLRYIFNPFVKISSRKGWIPPSIRKEAVSFGLNIPRVKFNTFKALPVHEVESILGTKLLGIINRALIRGGNYELDKWDSICWTLFPKNLPAEMWGELKSNPAEAKKFAKLLYKQGLWLGCFKVDGADASRAIYN